MHDKRLQVIKDLTLFYWPLFQRSASPADVLREFCQELEQNGCISLDVSNLTVAKPAIFVSNHLTVLEPLKILIGHTYSLAYHTILLDYVVEKLTGRPVSHISANPRKISPLLEREAERIGYLLVDRDASPRDVTGLNHRVAETLSAGRHISVAPEGHFCAWDGVGPFEHGFYHWARENSAEVIPVKLGGFETLGPRLEIRFAAPETASPSRSAADFVADIRERVFGKQFGLRLL